MKFHQHQRFGVALWLVVAFVAPSAAWAQPINESGVIDFSGAWDSTYGLLEIQQTGESVVGTYTFGGGSTIEGTVEDNRLTFRYHEPMVSGDGWFEINLDGTSLDGMWREDGGAAWSEWTGTRSARAPALTPSTGFEGLFDTTYGRMRLMRDGDNVSGTYTWGGGSIISGTIDGNRLTFWYQEPTVSGNGWFELSEDDTTLTGAWQEDGGTGWIDWTGERIQPEVGVSWLVILEAPWEMSLAENEYAFGDMLRAYFERMPNVEVRLRRFYDRADFFRAAADMAYLAEPVALLVASHGQMGELMAGDGSITATEIGEALVNVPNVFLIHFSSCEMMIPGVADGIRSALPASRLLALSGYATAVDWSASALIEFLYLDLVLGRGLAPERAAQVVIREVAFSGDANSPDSPLGSAMFRFDW